MSSQPGGADTHSGKGQFEQTQWTVILKARDEGAPGAQEAMETFARTYWSPIYRYIRRDGYRREDAQDLTQDFCQHLLTKQLLNGVGERKGRFRNYLLTCLKHFLADVRDKTDALNRGGGKVIISRDTMDEEERNAMEPADHLTPAQIFERRWAQAVFVDAMNNLRADYQRRGQLALFEELKNLEPGTHGERSHAAIAGALGMTEQAVKNAVLTFRRRYADCLRREVARTVETPGEVHEELNYLIQVFGS